MIQITTDHYQASTDLMYFAVLAGLKLPRAHPMLVDPAFAHLSYTVAL